MMKPARPTGVSILAILDILGGILAVLLGGVLAARSGSGLLNSVGFSGFTGLVTAIGGGVVIAGLLAIFVGWGMWTGKGWAWIVALILAGLGVLGGLGSLAFGSTSALVSLVIDVIIVWYLFRPHVKAYFGRALPQPVAAAPPAAAPAQPPA